MTDFAAQQPGLDPLALPPPGAIVEDIRQARRRTAVRFALAFAITWIVLIGGMAVAIASTGRVHPDFLAEQLPFFLGGVPLTIFVSVASIIFATGFAVIGALGRVSRNPVIYAIASLYVSLVRGTPLVVQIFFIYSALPQFGIVLPAIVAGVFALSFNYGAYMTEIFRAGIQAIPRGQLEAASALGMTERHTMRRIVMPQAIRIVIPAIGNEFIAMIKDSSLVSVVGLQELLWRADTVGRSNSQLIQALLIAAIVYWALTIFFSTFQARLERRMALSDVRV